MSELKMQYAKYQLAFKSVKSIYDLAASVSDVASPSEKDKQMLIVRFNDLDRYRQQMEDAYVLLSVDAKLLSEEQAREIENSYSTYNDMVYSIKYYHNNIVQADTESRHTMASQSKNSSEFRLPKIELARFSGLYTEWQNFISIFDSLIHCNSKLNNVEKMHYLLSVLDKEPLSLIKNLKISEENYPVAYNLLSQRYENKRIIADKHVDAVLSLSNLSAPINLKNLNKFLNTLKENLNALSALSFDVKSWSFLLLHIVLKKLPVDLRCKFESKLEVSGIPTFDLLLSFLEKQQKILENISITSVNAKLTLSNSLSVQHDKIKSNSTKDSTSSCPCQGENHQSLYFCPAFNAMTPEHRKAFVVKHRLCINCMRTHHISKCLSQHACGVCGLRHHTKLHINGRIPAQISTDTPTPALESNAVAASTSSSAVQHQSLHSVDATSTMLLGTAFVGVQDINGYFHPARAMIDCGSQISIISENLAQKLKLPRTQSSTVFGLGGQAQHTRGMLTCNIKSLNDSSCNLTSQFLILKHISNQLPSTQVNNSVIAQCKNLVLADKNFSIPGKIDLLLGIDLYNEVLDGRRISLGDNMPTAYSSIFGWIIMGKAPAASAHSVSVTSMACTTDLNFALTRFWEQEQPPSVAIPDPEDLQCEKHFCETHSRDDTGRFVVRLPFKVHHKPLGDTRLVALKRFHHLERRLLKDVQLRQLYIDFMRDYAASGHMREVLHPEASERYYIPHHGVLKEHSSTTKLRAVFDASTASSTSVSLNQVLMSGPKLQKNIEDIILRFRVHKVVFTCDIKQMYRQVRMHDSDCKYQSIFWRESPDQPLKQFELTTVTYGVTSSAFQAIRVIHELAYLNQQQHPTAASILLEDTFVDDVVSGANSIESAKELQHNLESILCQGGFVLRKWSSNSGEFLNSFSSDHCEQPYRFEERGDNIFKVLGIEWNADNDSFVYKVSEMNKAMTMRGVLSNIARLYDPCGLLAPVIFFAKHIMQQLWASKCYWDDPLPADIHKLWSSLLSDFSQFEKIKIPRRIISDQPVECQLHGFSDASERGYAACVYLRVLESDGRASAQLLLAKSRIAPLSQKLTVPKLELNGALLLARLLEHLSSVLKGKIKIESILAWCDSSIVLSWLKKSPHTLQTYEGNRVSQIQALMPNAVWRHVPSAQNPADPASRGLYPSQLVESSLWWSPSWLEADPSTWPVDGPVLCDSDLPGIKCQPPPPVSNVAEVEAGLLMRFGSFAKLLRVVAWSKRFLFNSRNSAHRRTGPLSVSELNDSELTIFRLVQSAEFSETLKVLQRGKCPTDSVKRLNPFIDSQGLIRVGGRLSKSQLAYDARHPILLPKNHTVTRLVVDHFHRLYLHPSINTLLNLLQRKYWILSARRVVRHQSFKCHQCYRLRPKSVEPFMGDLPSHRVTSCRPFQKVGVDFAGPFLIKASQARNARSIKTYLCVFICMSTKCVHLEIASELSTVAFFACLDRFVSRRGLPSDVFSDCGTNFVGTNNYLKQVVQNLKNSDDEIKQALARQQITWHFNPPSSPHLGGIWESAVKSAKTIIARVIGDRALFFEELATVFTKVEAVLNSRPLCPLTNDPNDFEVLTPGHFLIGQPLLALPEEDLENFNPNVLRRWHLLRQITQHFWKRWQAEYLHTLQQRPKWQEKIPNFQVGDLVLIKDPNLPPLHWKKARILRVCPGSDGTVRVVELKTSTGTLLRPVVKLCPLLSVSD